MAALLELTAADLDASLSEAVDQATLVDFYGDRCPSCRVVATLLQELGDEPGFDARMVKLNVDSHPDIAQRFGIRTVPTLVLFKDAAEVRRMPGLPSRAAIRAFIAGAEA